MKRWIAGRRTCLVPLLLLVFALAAAAPDADAQTLAIAGATVTEGDSGERVGLAFTVTLTPASSQPVTVFYADAGSGTATAGADYALIAGGPLAFAAGETTKTVFVSVMGDDVDEADETIQMTLSNPTAGTPIGTATGTGTITDDDATPTLSIDSPSVTEGGDSESTNLTFTATLSAASGRQVTVAYADAETGTATSGTDYTTFTGGTLTFTAGTTSRTFNVSVTGDTDIEANETVVVTLSGATNATLATTTGTGTITNDDGTTISVNSSSVREGNSGTRTLGFTITLSEASSQPVSIVYTDTLTGTATPGTDYNAPNVGALSGTIRIPAGATRQGFGFIVRGDVFDEEDETIVFRLSNATNATIATPTFTGTITDDDATPSIALTVDDTSVGESDGATTITVTATLDGTTRFPAARTVTVSVAGSGAASAVDFAAVSDFDIEIAAGAASGTGSFTLTPTADALDETNETVTVSGALGSLTVNSATITLTDDDATPSLSVDSPSVTEGDSGSKNLTFTATLSAASGKEVTVNWARAGGGTATSGTDYAVITGGTLTFPAETISQTFNVSVTGDTDDESNETILVFLSNAANATLATVAGTGTIIDDDGAPALSIDSPSVTEGDSGTKNLTFTVTLSPASTGQVTVNYADAGTGTARSGTDYTAITAGTLTFAAGDTSKTFDVAVRGDTIDESNETVVVTLSGATGATLATATGTGMITDNDDTPTLSIDSPSVTEGDSGTKNLTFTVTLSPASSRRVTVNYADGRLAGRGGTATSGTDYVAIRAGRLDFPVGTTNRTFNVAVRGDTIDELNETVVVLLGRPGNAVISTTAGSGTGTITDDDEPSLTLTVDDGSVGEGDGATTITVTATVDGELRFSTPTAVTVSVAGSGAATAVDFAAVSSFDITIPAGAASGTGTFTLTPTNDALDEVNETVTVSGVSGSLAVKSATITLADNDATPTLSIDSPSVTEGDSDSTNLTFTVTLSAASGQQVTVDYADAETGTATSGTDYTAITAGTLTFAAGTTSRTFDVSVTGDALDEVDETMIVTLSDAANATITTASGTGTIEDDDAAPTISISSPSLSEEYADRDILQFIITLSARSGKEVTVDVADAGTGTATSGTDYTATTSIQFNFLPGTTRQGVSIELIDDTMDEADETVVMTLSNATNATISSTAGSGTGTITDDDDPPTVSIDSQTVTEGDDGATNLEFTVTLSAASGKEVTVGYAIDEDSTATSVTDYSATASGTLTFDAGTTIIATAIEVTGDVLDEVNETIVINLSNATNATIATGTGTVTITDDDGPTVSIDSPSVTEGDTSVTEGDSGSTTLTFTVTLDEASVQPVTVDYADAETGTATSGTDYTAITADTLTFAVGTTSQTFDVSVTGDTTDEAGETVVVNLSNPTNATVSATMGTGTGTITNDDGPMVSIDSPSVTEGDSGSTTLTFTATLSAASVQTVTVDYADAGTGTATSGTDYTAITAGTLTFPVGTTSQTFDVSVTGDMTDELNETIEITLSNAANAAIATGTGRGTITNDDGTTLSINSPSVTEGDSGTTNLTFTVTLSATSAQQVTVDYADAGSGTATSGTDYTAITGGTLTFPVGGALSQTFNVAVTGDTTDEVNETVVVTLSNAANATISTATGTGTITDNDAAPTLSVNSPSVMEGDSGSTNLTFTVRLSAASGKQVTVAYADAGTGSATSGTDYTAITSGRLTFTAGTTSQTFNVAVTGDVLAESSETVLVSLSSPTNATVSDTAGTGTGTITNDDDAPTEITLTVDKSSVGEGDGATLITVTATVDGTTQFATATTVTVSVAGSGTASAVDFTAVSDFDITIGAGAASQTGTFTLTPTDDTADETDEKITVSGASGDLTVNSATISLTDDDDAPTLSINSPSVSEGNSGSTNLTFTVTLSPASAQQVTVAWAEGTGGTATSGTDYTAITGGTLTFAAGTTSQTFNVAALGDTLDEANETVVVTLSSPTNAAISNTAGTGTGTITDDDATPTLSINSPSVAEGNSGSTNLTFTVRLSAASGRQVTVAYADATTGTATSGTDYTTITGGTLTFTAGTTSRTFNVSVTGDTTDEVNETVVVTLSGATNATVSAMAGTGTGTITDDDGPTVSVNSLSVTEGDSGSTNLTFTATLSAASVQQVTVDYTDAETGTATSGTDYTAITDGTLTFTAGTTSQTFAVSVTGDTTDEVDETVVVTLSNPTNATIATASGTGTITDDDGPAVSVNSPSVTEGDSGSTTLTFTATLSAASVQPVTVAYADAGTGTATSETDYTALTAGTLTFPVGTTSQTFNVAVTGDTTDELNETVVVTLSDPTSATIATATGTGTITDDDGPTVSVNSPSVTEGDSGSTTLTFTATLSAASVQPVTVDWGAGTGGSATSGTDYTAITVGTLTFTAGTTSQTFNVAVTGDTTDELNETVVVTLSDPTNATISTGTGTGTITDDDGPAVSIDSPSVTEGDSGSTTLTFTATLSAASVQPVTVAWAEGTGGTATSGTDYTALTGGTLTFAAGATSRTFAVSVTGDTTDEVDETVVVTLSSPTNATIATATGTGTITDDDGPAVSIDSPSVTEGDSGSTTLMFTATLSAASVQPVTVAWAEGTGGTATSGTDYTALTGGTLTFAAGATSRTFAVAVTGDTTDEVDETVVVTLSNPTNATIATGTGTGTITDDDGPAVSIDSPSVTEGDSGSTTLTFTATLSAASVQPVTVAWAEGTGGTATSGTDYTALTGGTLTFAAGATSRTFAVAVMGDTTDEVDETVVVTLSNPTNATIATGTGTGTITDDDAPPSLSVDSPSVTEGESGSTTLTFTATLSAASGKQVTVAYADAGTGTATAGTDYTALTGGTLTFTAGTTSRTFNVSVMGDALDEANETVVVILSSATNATIATGTGTGTITDDDDAPSLSVNSPSVTEGDSSSTTLTFTATLNTVSGQQVTVAYADAGTGTATAGTDYTALTGGTLTFAAGTTSRTFDVSVTGDATDEVDETIVVTLSSATNAMLATATGTGTITDDDDAPSLSIDSPSVTEGESGSTTLTFTATLSAASGKQVTVAYADAGTGTATAGTDYTALNGGTLTFTAGTTSRTFDVSVTGDATDEVDETIVVTLSSATNAMLATATGTGTITDDDDAPSLSIDSPSVTEGESGSTTLTFTATLSAASGKQVTVAYADAGTGTATAGTDYTALNGGTLTFTAGTTSRTFDVSVTGDALDEANETVVVTLSSATLATLATATGTGTITDDDAPPSLSVNSPSVTEGDSSSTTLTFTATLNTVSGQQVTVAYADAGTGTATSGTDYTALTGGTLTFAAGTTSRTFDVSVTGDALDEANETIVVTLSSATNAMLATATGTGTITDDDDAPSLSIDSPSVTEGESGSTTLTFTATLSAASGRQVTVAYADAGTGTATAGTDYTALTGGTLTFTAGTTSRTFDVSVTGDATDEVDETIVVTLSSATNAMLATATGTGTITDDDDAPSLSIDSPSVTEGESGSTTLTFTATLSAASGKQVTVAYADAGTGTATAGTDYTALTGGTLTFTAGTTSRTFDVSVTGDALDEANETIVVTLSSATNATLATATGTGTITDDDAAGIAVSPATTSAFRLRTTESAGTATFTVTLASEPTGTVVLAVASTNTAEGTVSAASLTFTATTWNTAQPVTLTGVNDSPAVADGNQPYTVTLTVNQGSTADPIYDALSAVTVYAVNADNEYGLDLPVTSGLTTTETGGTATFPVALLTQPASAVTVSVTSRDPSEGTASPSSLTFTPTTWNTNQTVTVTGVDDPIDDGEVTWAVRLDPSSNDPNYNGLDNEDVSVTTTDNDAAPTVTLALSPTSIAENGGMATVTATLNRASSAATTVTVSPVSGFYTWGRTRPS